MRIVIALVVALGACDHDESPPRPPDSELVNRQDLQDRQDHFQPTRAAPSLPTPTPTGAGDADDDHDQDDTDATDDQPADTAADSKPIVIDLSHDVQVVYVDRDVDRDGEGIPDVEDRCPDMPENINGYEDVDGCPEPAPP